jgi:hypothetical protein
LSPSWTPGGSQGAGALFNLNKTNVIEGRRYGTKGESGRRGKGKGGEEGREDGSKEERYWVEPQTGVSKRVDESKGHWV